MYSIGKFAGGKWMVVVGCVRGRQHFQSTVSGKESLVDALTIAQLRVQFAMKKTPERIEVGPETVLC